MSSFIERFNQRTQTSKKLAQDYRSFLADNKTFVDFNLPLKEIFYPIVAKSSSGAKILDVDGNEYIDLTMGFGVNLFGHNPSFIKEALVEQLEKGIQIGPQAELAGEVAQLICEFTGMDRVAFSNTGTEAVMTAIRVARTTTKRNKIVLFNGSYHGHFDGTLAKRNLNNANSLSLPIFSGTPLNFVQDVLVLDYGNDQSLELIKTHALELAAVLVEPVQTRNIALQPQEFLQQLRKLTQDLDIPLIFDEMVTGFRIHPGGAQAWFGIQADIATYGKIVGGGMPIGVIAGKAKYMNAIDGGIWHYGDASYPQEKTTFFAGTFCKHPLVLAAAKAVLNYLKTQGADLQEKLNYLTSDFVAKLNTYFAYEQLPIHMTSFGSIFGTINTNNEAEKNPEAAIVFDLLYYHLLVRGIMLRGNGGFLSTAHTAGDIETILLALQDSVQELRAGYFLP
ncbi:aspartate aminotransferase family protein [Nostoc flagelliforme]|uniref:aspartate aminotransferase family protein n=1 Tax=Nostoc flagelliforme TaxID=1306274 RepID=UPI00298E7645|nr:aspartate aminotransferase family protein [Nostoc flagelliforme]